ncbi:MAG: M12 family metallo-peptidase [Vicinamibacterales bacterium]
MTHATFPRFPRRFWMGALLLAVVVLGRTGDAQTPVVPALFGAPADARVPAAMAGAIDTVQSRAVAVNTAALAASTIDIALTGGRVVRAVLDRRESSVVGTATWAGHVEGEPLSSVTLVTNGGILQGSVRLLDGSYSIEPAGGGPQHVVRLVDTTQFVDDLGPIVPPAPDAASLAAAAAPAVANDDGSTFDVLVMYTPAAVTAAGGTPTDVQTRIALGVSETNTAYANSGITPRLRLVGAEQTNYTESGNLSTDLDRFRNAADGFMDEVHTRRDALGADLVVLVVGSTAGGACGVGYVMTALTNAFASNAFSVSAYPCISPNYTFAHELGHNMGSAHAPEDGSGQASLYPYSFGYKNPSNLFRTIMAYDCPSSCPRILYFSNPNVNYNSAPTGTALQHDNARSINSAALTIANWRQAASTGAPPTITAIANVTIDEDTATSPIAFTVNDAETPAANLTVTATSSNTQLVANTGAALNLAGTGGARTLTVTPAANKSGTTTITVTVSDGSQSASRAFTLTVNAVNDAPTLTRTPASGTIANGLVAHTTVTITDIDTAGSNLTLTGSSSNPTLLPNTNIAVTPTNTTATSRTFDVAMTPAAGQAGTATVTLDGSDGAAPVSATYTLTVTIPVPPTISAIGPQSVAEDGVVDIPVSVNDADTPLLDLVVTATSSNTTLVPASAMSVSGTTGTRSLRIVPVANASGTSTITVTVNDGLATAQTSFVLTVTAVDDPPAYAPGAPVAISTVISTPTTFAVTITDIDTAGASLTLTGTSSNVALLANAGISIAPTSATASSRTFDVTVSPVAGATGTAVLALVARDGTSPVGRTVQLSVTASPAAPDAPTTLTASANALTLNLSWTPATTGSTPATYSVEVGNAPGATQLVQSTASTSLSVALPTGGTYYARVKAVNVYGTSVASPEVSVTVAAPNPKPGAPQSLAATFSGRTVGITWAAPLTGDPVTNYILEVGSAPGLANIVVVPVGAATSFAAAGVPDGVFWIRVRGANGSGTGPASADLALVMNGGTGCVGLPFAPVFRTPVVSGSTASFSWDAPTAGATPVSYVLFAGSAPGRSDLAAIDLGSAATTFAATAPAGTYFLRVAARGACGVGPVSNDATMTIAPGGVVPTQPTGLAGTVSGGIVSLQWTAPASGAAPTSYVVEVGSASGISNILVLNTGNVATAISGPVPRGRYFIRIRTRAGTLVSPASNEVMIDVP